METRKERALMLLDAIAQEYADLDLANGGDKFFAAGFITGLVEALRVTTGLVLDNPAHADALAAMVDADLTEVL